MLPLWFADKSSLSVDFALALLSSPATALLTNALSSQALLLVNANNNLGEASLLVELSGLLALLTALLTLSCLLALLKLLCLLALLEALLCLLDNLPYVLLALLDNSKYWNTTLLDKSLLANANLLDNLWMLDALVLLLPLVALLVVVIVLASSLANILALIYLYLCWALYLSTLGFLVIYPVTLRESLLVLALTSSMFPLLTVNNFLVASAFSWQTSPAFANSLVRSALERAKHDIFANFWFARYRWFASNGTCTNICKNAKEGRN